MLLLFVRNLDTLLADALKWRNVHISFYKSRSASPLTNRVGGFKSVPSLYEKEIDVEYVMSYNFDFGIFSEKSNSSVSDCYVCLFFFVCW